MKTIPTLLAAHLAGEVTTLATCWKLKRRDGVELGFTNHDRDLVVSGLTYQAKSGFTPSAISSSSGLSVDNLDLEGLLDAGSITEADIMAGKYDFAEIEIFMVNHADLSQGLLALRKGWMGEVSVQNGIFIAEMRGLAQKLAQNIGELFSPSCRASLGDSRCKVNMTLQTHTGTVTTATGRQEFKDSARSEASGIFSGGSVTFTSGANNGLSMEVKEYIYQSGSGGRIILAMPMPYAISVNDQYSMNKGCDKTLATCKARFDNVANFRGEPHVPGMDRMMETAGTRSQW